MRQSDTMKQAAALLKQYFGHDSFRGGQDKLVERLTGGGDAVGIMPTGAGKSICYQLPALMADGVTVVVSPLISLMKDQVNALNQMGVPAAYLNSSLTERQFRLALSRAYNGAYKIIYVAPERLETEGFMRLAESIHISMLAIDEAHCISQWGQDFRPSYLKIRSFIDAMTYRPVIGAFTATATANVRNDIIRILALKDPLVVTTGFDRKNLYFGVEHPTDKYAALKRVLKRNSGRCGIVYCSTRKTVEEVCGKLCTDGFNATRYHAGLDDTEKSVNQEDFLYDRRTIMVATNAFGMGIDKSNVSFVVHYNMPKDIESYYQEAGRAGRDGEEAECILLYAKKDVATAKWFIEHPSANEMLSEQQAKQVKQRDEERLRQMTFYSTTGHCLRRFILNYFGDRSECECGKCSSCRPELQAEPRNAKAASARNKPNIQEKTAPARNKPNIQAKAAPPPFTSADEELFARLKALRAEKAKVMGVPAFVVFSDATLRDMCRRKPKTQTEFLAVSGVGDVKAERFGNAFIEEINAYMSGESGSGGDNNWDDIETEKLKRELLSGKTVGEMVKAHGRTVEEILKKLKDFR